MIHNELTITIVSYNSYEAINKHQSELLHSNRFQLQIFDNNSPDGSGKRLADKFPNVTVIQNKVNLGYGRAANIAINNCSTPYLLLINPDVRATSSNVSELLSRFSKAPKNTALIAPAVDTKHHIHQGLIKQDWVLGAAMMFNVQLIKQIGLFDENIFLFSEESDLCKRIISKGYAILLDTDLYIEHLFRQSSSTNKSVEALINWHKAWSKMYFHEKHNTNSGKNNPYRVATIYWYKYLLSLNQKKKQRYKYRLKGTLAFIRGDKAITSTGEPYSPVE